MHIKSYLFSLVWVLLIALTSCHPNAVKTTSPPPSPPTLSIRPAPTNTPPTIKSTPQKSSVGRLPTDPPELTPFAPAQNPCPSDSCILNGHFVLSAPLPGTADLLPDASYRYGYTQSGKRLLHHGIDIKNPLGTPVLAAGDGVVIAAGNDKTIQYGDKEDFYGNLVIIQHDVLPTGQALFTLYGHLSKVEAEVGQWVKAGEVIGKVGMTGVAIGYHLHFEVRVGENTYENTRNPELWIEPQNDEFGRSGGALVGRITNSAGEPMRIAKIVLKAAHALPEEPPIYLNTYDDPVMPRRIGGARDDSFLMPYQDGDTTLGRDDSWREDFALSNLSPGNYFLTFSSQIVYRQEIEIKSGQVTLVNIKADF